MNWLVSSSSKSSPLEALIHFDSCRHLPVVVLAHFVQCFEQAFLLVRKRTFGSPAKKWSVSWLCNTFTKKLSKMCHHSGWTTSVQHVKPVFWPTWHYIMGGIAEETYLETAKLKIELVDLILTSSTYARIVVSFHYFYVQPECCGRWIPFDHMMQLRKWYEMMMYDCRIIHRPLNILCLLCFLEVCWVNNVNL